MEQKRQAEEERAKRMKEVEEELKRDKEVKAARVKQKHSQALPD
jgi:hypothetical protein